MKKVILLLLFLSVGMLLNSCATLFDDDSIRVGISSDKAAHIKKIAVLPFNIHYAVKPRPDFVAPPDEGITVADIYTTEFMMNGFQCIERGQIQKVLEEQNLQLSGLVDSNSDIAEVGNLLGVNGIVIGTATYDGTSWVWTLKLVDCSTADIGWVVTAINQQAKNVVFKIARELNK